MPTQPRTLLRDHLLDLAKWISEHSDPSAQDMLSDPEKTIDMYLSEREGVFSAPYAERVRTDAGWHGRLLGANHEPVWTTEVLESKANVRNAYEVLVALLFADPAITDRDERTSA